MLKIADRIKETSLTTGTGSIILNGAFGGFQRFFAVIDDSNTTYYTIENGANWEVGQGTYTTSSNSLSRDIVFDSSSGGSKIDLQGVSTVFCTLPASKAVVRNTSDSISLNNIYVSGEANINQISTNNIHNSGDSFLGGDTIVSGDLSVLGNFDFDINGNITADDITADFLTLIRPNSAGNFFHAYKDDGTNQTVSLYVTSAVSPLWRLGLKSSPSSQTESPSFGYVYGRDGSVGIVSNISNYLSLSDSDGVSIVNDSHEIVTISSDDGMVIDQKSTVNPALVIEAAPLSVSNLQEWANSAGTAFSVVDQAGKFGILNDNPTYDLDVTGSGRLQSVYLTNGIYFQDGTFQNSAFAGTDPTTVSGWADVTMIIRDNAISGWAASTFLTSDDDSIANFASGLAVQNELDIVTVSGIAVYASGHDLQSITDNGSTTTNPITVSNNNITASSGLFDSLDMTPLAQANYPAHQEGVVFYDTDNHTLSLYNDEADVTLQLGQEEFLRVRNNTGATIANGTAVLITGSHGNAAPTISGAIATSESASQVVGLATHDIENSSFGYVTTYGIVRNVDTSHCSGGDEIFLSATEVGSGVNVSPTIPNYKVTIGHVIRSHGSNGSILVQIGHPKLGGGDLKSEAELNLSGVPFVTSKSDTTAGGSQTDPLFIFDSGNRQLQLGSGLQLLDGVPSNTSNVLYNEGGNLKFNGSSIGSDISTSGIVFEKSGSNDEFRIGTTFIDADGTEQVVRATDFNGGFLRLEVARFSPSVSAAGQSRSWDQPVTQWTVTVDNPTDFTTNYVSGVKSPLTGITGSVTSDVTLYSTSGPSVTPGGGVDWTQTFSTDGDSPIYSSTNNLTGGSASATVSFLDKNQATISETATITFNWSNASNAISFGNLSGKNFLETYTSTTYNLTINNISDLSNTSTTITSSQGSLSNSSDDGTITFTTAIHKDNNSGRTITATTDFTRPATVTGTEYTSQDVSSDSSISASFTYPSFYIFTASTSNVPSRADIVDTNDFDSSTVTELGDQAKTIDQYINNPDGVPKCWWFGVRSSASQPTSFETGSGPSLLVGATPTEATVDLEPDSPPAGYNSEEYKLYGITLNPGNTYVKIS